MKTTHIAFSYKSLLCGLTLFCGLAIAAVLHRPVSVFAAASLSITPITWNIIGLDSNNVNVGPNHFPVGVRVCNTGDAPATNVTSAFFFDSANAFINLRPGTLTNFNATPVPSLAPGACTDFYYEVEVTRNAAAYDTTRRYHITATADTLGTVSTPTPRELYVEHLISQSRNHVLDVKLNAVSVPNGGMMTLVVGQTYTIELVGSTATNGYEQIESFINFPNTIFQVLAVSTAYSADTSAYVSNPDDKLYGDGCKWENDPNSPYYRSCRDVGKAGGSVNVTYQIKVLQVPGMPLVNPQPLSTLLYDFSGSSFHYNDDFGTSSRIVAVVDPTTLTLAKNFSPDPTNVNGVSALTFTITTPNPAAVSGVNFSDVFPTAPGAMVVANPPDATINGCGAATFAPVAGAGSISFSNGTVAANSSCTVKVNVTTPATGTYTNTSNHLFVGATDTGKFATDTLTVNTTPPAPPPVCGFTLAQWAFPAGFSVTSPAPSTDNAPGTPSAKPGDGITSTSFTEGTNSWGSNGDVTTGTTLVFANEEYVEFAVNMVGFTGLQLSFNAARKNTPNSPRGIAVYAGTSSLTTDNIEGNGAASDPGTVVFAPNATALPLSTTAFTSFGPLSLPDGATHVRIYFFNSNNTASGSDIFVDNVTFTGCVPPSPPTISKSFSPSPVAVNGASTLTFTITNPNTGLALSGITFNDTLPAGVTVTTGSSAQCGGTLNRTAPSTLSFTGGTLAASGSCMVTATVTVTTAGPHDNVSGFVSSTEAGTNTGPTGIATASITGILPPAIAKQFAPNPVLAGTPTTLTFTLTNPNASLSVAGVAFSDTLPTSPGALVVANPTGATTNGCGAATFAPAPGSGSISFSGGTIAPGGTCIVTVNVVPPVAGSYANTSGMVSHLVNGSPVNGNTASDTLTATPANPAIALLKQVGPTASGPWSSFLATSVGGNVFYRFTVENIGNVPLNSVSVTDPQVSTASCTWPSPLPVAVAANDNHIATCVVGPVAALSGTHPNTATASGTNGTTVMDTSSATYATTGLTLAKSVTQSSFTSPGDTLNYSYLVTNSGFAALAGPVTVADNKTTVTCPAVSTVGDLDNFLDPNESITCTATYTVTAGDVAALQVTNIATASADGVNSNSDSRTVPLSTSADVSLVKTLITAGPYSSGQSINYTLVVANGGPSTATNIQVTDTPTNLTITNVSGSGCTTFPCTIASLASMANTTINVTATINASGAFDNSATATATQPDPNTTNNTDNTGNGGLTGTAADVSLVKTLNTSGPFIPGQSISYTLVVANGGPSTATNIQVTDTPTNLTITNVSGSGCTTFPCTIASLASMANTTINVTATINASGAFDNSATATATEPDPNTNNNTDNTGNGGTATISPPSIAKAFSPNPIAVGGVSTLTFTITNPNSGTSLTGVAFTDTFPAGLQVAATPNATTTGCGSPTFAPASGNTSLSFSGGTILASGTCTVTVNVTATTSGAKVNTTGNVTSTNGGTGNTGTDTLTVLAAPSIAKAFSPNSIAVGGVSTLTLTITNPNAGTALNGVAFTDSFPAGLEVATTPNASTSGCGSPTFAPAAGNTSLSFSGGAIAASGTCTVTVNVTATTAGAKPNTTGNVTSTNGGAGNTASATLTVIAPPTISKAFGAASIPLYTSGSDVGFRTSLTFTITNPNASGTLTGVSFSDTLPSGLVIANGPFTTSNSCGINPVPTLSGAVGGNLFSVSGAQVAVGAPCIISLNVRGTTIGTKNNTTSPISSTEGGTNNGADGTASATLTVVGPPSIAKAFAPNPIAVGGVSTLTFTITNPNTGTSLTGVSFTDSFPAGLQVAATPNATTTGCGAPTFAPAASNTSLSFSGGAIAASGTCTVTVNVTATSGGAKVNTTSNVTSTNGGTGNTDTDTLTALAPPSIAKAFAPNQIALGGVSTLTFTITNPNTGTALTGVAFTDSFPAGVQVAATPNASTSGCGAPTFAPAAGNTSLSFSGGTIAANGTCTASVNVTATTSGSKVNTTSNVTSTNGGTGNTGAATLTVTSVAPPSVTKAFGAPAILLNGVTSLTLTINNPNAFPLTGVAVTDNLPAGLVVATPNGLMNTCSGTVSAVAGSSLLSLTGGTIAASSSCTLKINVRGTTPGTKNNQTGAVSSNETGPGAPSNIATLAVHAFTVSITDPLVCFGPGGVVAVTATFTNGAPIAQSADFTATLSTGLAPLAGSCNTSAGTCTVNANTTPTTINVNVAALGAGQTVTVTYQTQLGDVPAGAQVCINSQVAFGGGAPLSVQACLTVNCPAVGPGLPYPAAAEVSDQKAGSVLFYNLYSSSSAAPNAQNTRVAITNTHPARAIAVHLFFVDGATCSIADSLLCLTPNQTASFLASDIDPGTTGYIVAVASDLVTGCPVNFNYLIGDEYVKLSSGHAANLAAEAFAALAGGLPACDATSVTAMLNFDGLSYNRAPRALAASNIPSRADGNDTLLVLNRIGGSLLTGAATLSNLFGLLYDDAETPLSFNFNPGTCQFRSSLSNNFPRVAPRFEQFIPAGRSGWAKFYAVNDSGLLGAQLNFNPNAGTAGNAFNQGHNLHKLTFVPSVLLTIPIFPPNC